MLAIRVDTMKLACNSRIIYKYILFVTLSLSMISCGTGENKDLEDKPLLYSITPNKGSVNGGDLVTISGVDFNSQTSVLIGKNKCTDSQLVSSSQIQCNTARVAPYAGLKKVTITQDKLEVGFIENGFEYTCPWIYQSSPNCGAIPPVPAKPQNAEFVISSFQEGHGFYSNKSGNHNYNDVEDFTIGSQSLRITTESYSSEPKYIRNFNIGEFDFTDKMPQLKIKIDNTRNLSSAHLYLGDSNLENFFKFKFRSSQGQKWITDNDWVTFSFPWTGSHTSITGSPDRSFITDAQIRIISNAEEAITMHVNQIAAVKEQNIFPNGVLSFTFDDGYISQYSVVKPILEAKLFSATAYIIAKNIGNGKSYMTLANLKSLEQSGWEIAAHSYSGKSHGEKYTSLTLDELEKDIIYMRQWLISNGFSGYNHCAYPNGSFKNDQTENILPLIRAYYTSCRTIHELHRESIPPSDAHKLRVYYITNVESLEAAKTAITHAQENKEWIILVFHKITENPTHSTEWSKNHFQKLVNFVDDIGISVKTVGDVLSY